MGGGFEVVAEAITWAAGIASVATLGVEAGGYARQWPGSYRRTTGWTLAGLGLLLVGGAAWWLIDAHLAPLRGQGLALTGAGATGLLLSIVGLTRAVRAPVDSGVQKLRALAWAVERQVNRLDAASGFDHRRGLSLRVERDARVHRRVTPAVGAVSRMRARLALLAGDSGSGKTLTLRQIARRECQKVQRQRRPQRIAVYIDLASLAYAGEAATADVIRSHLQEAITVGDATLRAHLDEYLREPCERPEWLLLFDSFGTYLASGTRRLRRQSHDRMPMRYGSSLVQPGPTSER